MKDLSQSGGDGANMSQAARDVVNNYFPTVALDRDEARSIVEEIISDLMPALTAQAKDVWRDLTREVAEAVIEKLAEDDPESLARFREPRIQIALGSAQRGYASAPSVSLREMLSDLVAATAREQAQTHRDLILRQAINVAAKLTKRQLNSLSAILLLNRTVFYDAEGAADLLESLDRLYKPYLGAVVENSGEYSYLASLGCGVEFQLTSETFGGPPVEVLGVLYKSHQWLMYESFFAEEFLDSSHRNITESPNIKAIPHYLNFGDHTSVQFKYRFTDQFGRRAIGGDSRGTRSSDLSQVQVDHPLDAAMIIFAIGRLQSANQFAQMAAQDYPDLLAMFQTFDGTKAMTFQPNAVGRMLGFVNAAAQNPTQRALLERLLLDEPERDLSAK